MREVVAGAVPSCCLRAVVGKVSLPRSLTFFVDSDCLRIVQRLCLRSFLVPSGWPEDRHDNTQAIVLIDGCYGRRAIFFVAGMSKSTASDRALARNLMTWYVSCCAPLRNGSSSTHKKVGGVVVDNVISRLDREIMIAMRDGMPCYDARCTLAISGR